MDHPYRSPSSFRPTSLLCFIALVIFLVTSTVLASPQTGGNETDRLTLLEIKAKLVDPVGVLSSWNESNHFCQWHGVTCGRRHQRVTMLSLESLSLSGSLSPHIGNLSFLRELHLKNNSFNSNIPLEVSRLFRLEKLFLHHNYFDGHIPSNLSQCSNLLILYLGKNKLEGNIPKELGSLPKLQELVLEENNLIGNIPTSFGNLSSLHALASAVNNLGGSIPDTLGQLKNLNVLLLNNNSFTGHIPTNISLFANLLAVSLGNNKLEGSLPKELGSLSRLQLLDLYENNFVGNIPSSFGNLSSLRRFSISRNNLRGSIPDTLGQLRNLNELFLAENMFVSFFPCSIFNISSITALGISFNELEGSLPSNLGFALPNLKGLIMDVNHFTGQIPQSISNVSNLQYFSIMDNNFAGEIPSFAQMRQLFMFGISHNTLGSKQHGDLNFLCSLTNSTRLHDLSVQSCDFGGNIPKCISNLSVTLQYLFLDDNYISGSLPNGIENLINLEMLDLSSNRISGDIPSRIANLNQVRVMNFGQNEFSGQIPQSLGNLSTLIKLGLDNNHLQGSIPSSWSQLEGLLSLDLSNNNLSGSIPPELFGLSSLSIYLGLSRDNLTGSTSEEVGNLKHIGELHLDNNRLSGEIPKSIGECTSMEGLYLQDNFFEGLLPSTLSSLRGIRVMDFSNNKLSRPISRFLRSLNLSNLSLSYNDFEDALPITGVFESVQSTSVVGNKKLYRGLPELQMSKYSFMESHMTGRNQTPKVVIICTISTLVAVACIFLLSYFFWYRHNKKVTTSSMAEDGLLNVSYHSLLEATNGFSSINLVGTGSFGSVYKGLLNQTQTIMAIKIFYLTCHAASKSFITKCEALRRIRHRNLMKMLTACSGIDFNGNDFKALVYEFMAAGSLDEWLHLVALGNEAPRTLKVNIAISVACALDYLHHQCEIPVVHYDLKPSNVLLHDKFIAHVGDFGLARFLPEATHKLLTNWASSIGVKGSFGYIA